MTGQSSSILTVLVFGAGTDYALLIVARYREELRRTQDKHASSVDGNANRRPGDRGFCGHGDRRAPLPSLAEVNGTAGLALIGASGIAISMLVMCTLLPALLAIFGRRAFWPFIPRYGSEGTDATHGIWRRIAERVGYSPRRVWIGSVAVLVVMSIGLVYFNTNLTTGNGFRDEESSTRGQDLVARAFPAGANVPNTVLVPPGRDGRGARRARAAARGGCARARRDRIAGCALRPHASRRSLLDGGLRPDPRPEDAQSSGPGERAC